VLKFSSALIFRALIRRAGRHGSTAGEDARRYTACFQFLF